MFEASQPTGRSAGRESTRIRSTRIVQGTAGYSPLERERGAGEGSRGLDRGAKEARVTNRDGTVF